MLLLSSAALADAYVLLQRDVTFCPAAADKDCVKLEQPFQVNETWKDARPWKLLEDKGDWLFVELPAASPDLCLAPLSLAPGLSLRAWVPRKYLVPALTEVMVVKGPAVDIQVAAGTAVGDNSGGRVVFASDWVSGRVVATAKSGDSWSLVPVSPPTGGATSGLRNAAAVPLEELGSIRLAGNRNYGRIDAGESVTMWSDGARCVVAQATLTSFAGTQELPPFPAAEAAAAPTSGETLAAGTALSWPGGGDAGSLGAALVVEGGKKKKGKLCFDAWPGEAELTLCGG